MPVCNLETRDFLFKILKLAPRLAISESAIGSVRNYVKPTGI